MKETARNPKRQQTSTALHIFKDNYLHTYAVFVNVGKYISQARHVARKGGEEKCWWES
jgi:hypothetical protein